MDRVVVCPHGPRSPTRCDSLTAWSEPTGTTWPNLLPGLLDTPCTTRLRTRSIPARPISITNVVLRQPATLLRRRNIHAAVRSQHIMRICETPRPAQTKRISYKQHTLSRIRALNQIFVRSCLKVCDKCCHTHWRKLGRVNRVPWRSYSGSRFLNRYTGMWASLVRARAQVRSKT